MRIFWHAPAVSTVYAQRSITNGYCRAFAALGHDVRLYTAGMDTAEALEEFQPDLFITAVHFFYRKQLDVPALDRARSAGLRVLAKLDFWNPLPSALRRNESISLRDDKAFRRLCEDGSLADAFFHVVEQGDPRMEGFEAATGRGYATVPLAADGTLAGRHDERFAVPSAYIGTFLPAKRDLIEEVLFPLRRRGLALYGQDWTTWQRFLGKVQRVGQYFNVPVVRDLQRPSMSLQEEMDVYRSAGICVNLHEYHQRLYGGDCNERTFKIPAAGGFQLVDDVACISRYFRPGEEIVMADSTTDFMEKYEHYLTRPEERARIASAGHERALREHTYEVRAQQLLDL